MKRSIQYDIRIKWRVTNLTRRELIQHELENMSQAEKTLCDIQGIPYREFAKQCADQLRKLYR